MRPDTRLPPRLPAREPPPPLIGITTGTRVLEHAPNEVVLRATYPAAVIAAGGIPVVLPPTADEGVLAATVARLDGLLLSGGGDIAAHHFNAAPHPTTWRTRDESRDMYELWLTRHALAHHMPTLGICRGVQMLNVAAGGTLLQDIASEHPTECDHGASERDAVWVQHGHTIHVAADSRLAAVLGCTAVYTNTLHHQAVATVAPGLRVTAHAPDGIIEALERDGEGTNGQFLIGVQCHPEALVAAGMTPWRRLFAAFVAAARAFQQQREGV